MLGRAGEGRITFLEPVVMTDGSGYARLPIILAHDPRARPFQQAALGVGRFAGPGQDHGPARQADEDGQAVHYCASQSGIVSPSISASIGGRARTTAHLSPVTSTSGVSGRLLYVPAIVAP